MNSQLQPGAQNQLQSVGVLVWQIYRTLVSIGAVCALLIVLVYLLTETQIQHNHLMAIDNAIMRVLPGATKKQTFVWQKDVFVQVSDSFQDLGQGSKIAYAGFDDNNQLVGIALLTSGRGYQDVISIIFGYSPNKQALIGMQVLTSRETPGLGDKIEKAPHFIANFRHLDVALDENGQLKNDIVLVKQGAKSQPWQIDGITGATISSQAITDMTALDCQTWIPLLVERLTDFKTLGDEAMGEGNTGV